MKDVTLVVRLFLSILGMNAPSAIKKGQLWKKKKIEKLPEKVFVLFVVENYKEI
ncbi:MAG: hypothetical protein Q8P81_03510 [Nanoarchaeota archaeon]|nr:hypothetical protein [Nanoarchaeota archaeon]